jgi:hypothetical protein
MQNKKAYELVTTEAAEKNTRHSPHNGFNKLLRALPGDQELFATVTSGIGVSGPTGPTSPSANLTPTLRRQDHTTLPVREWHRSSLAPPRPPHPAANVRDDRETPLECGAGRREIYR